VTDHIVPATDAGGHPEALALLSLLFAPEDLILIRPIETWVDGDAKRSQIVHNQVRTITAAQLTRPHIFGSMSLQTGRDRSNLFYGVCPRPGPTPGFDLAWQIRTVRALWSDVDDCTPDVAIERCDAAGIPCPSAIVSSGHGAHLYWALDAPYLIDDAGAPPQIQSEWIETDGKRRKIDFFIDDAGERVDLHDHNGRGIPRNRPQLSPRALHVQDVISGLATKIGGDHTQDLSRLLRLPGTMNRKDERNGRLPVPCRLVEIDANLRYPIEEFARFAELSPEAGRRRKIAEVRLPTPKPLRGAKKRDTLNELITTCAVAGVGQRSEADFSLCCWAVENGVSREAVWSEASGVGKFAERGEAYFLRTWERAEQHTREDLYENIQFKAAKKAERQELEAAAEADEPIPGEAEAPATTTWQPPARTPVTSSPKRPTDITNARVVEDLTVPRPMPAILDSIRQATDNWPRRVGSSLFTFEKGSVAWLQSAPSLFGFLGAKAGRPPVFQKEPGCHTKEEVFHELRRTATDYRAVELIPHEPPIEGHFYACDIPEPGDGSALRELVSRFSPETPIDADLLTAMFVTAIWGGPPGARPAFLIGAPQGRGAGKSTAAKILCHFAGGSIDLSANEDAQVIKQRLLSPDGLKKRIALLDNVKSMRFSWAELEAMITAPTISGKAMFVGEADRPNTLLWVITLNGASLSTDMAQRCVVIHLARAEHSGTWESETVAFVNENRVRLVADCIAFLRSDGVQLEHHSRWGAWERAILSRLPEPTEAQALIAIRQQVADVEVEEADVIEEFFQAQLDRLEYMTDREQIFIPSAIVARWLSWATNEKYSSVGAGRLLKQRIEEGRMRRLSVCPNRHHGRGFYWTGEHADPEQYGTRKDVNEKLRAHPSHPSP
jgi:hypothetical protein